MKDLPGTLNYHDLPVQGANDVPTVKIVSLAAHGLAIFVQALRLEIPGWSYPTSLHD